MVELVTRALALAPPDSREAGYLLARYGDLMARVEGDYDSAQQAFGRAMTIAQREQDVAMETRILAQWAHTDYAHFRLQECLEKCLKVIELARRADEPRAEVNARHHAVLVLYWMGDLEGSRHNAVSTLALAERLRDRTWLPQALWDNAVVSLAGGDWRAARDHIDSGLAIAPQDFRLLKTRIQLEYQVGEFSQGKAHLEQLLELMRQTPPGPTFEYALPAVVIPMIARITGGLDHLDIAEAAAATALSSPYATPIFSITARTGLALLAELRGEALAVGEAYVALESKRGMMLPSAASIDRLLGLLSLTMGHLDRAAVHFEDALSLCRKAGYRPELAWTCCDYAEGLLVGATHQVAPTSFADREKAMSLLNEALTISQELGMRPLMERVVALKEKGELQPRRGRDTSGRIASNFADGLTEREMEVLRLLASGRSNREIAEKLLISVRTAGNHVRNILTKTGTSNRTEAVAYAIRNGLV